jgi:hypothetical protein
VYKRQVEGCTSNAMDRACGSGHLEIVKWLHDNRNEGFTEHAMICASANGHTEIVEYLNGIQHG